MAALQSTSTVISSKPESLSRTLTTLIDRLPEGVLLLNRDWQITYANETACKISHLTPANFHRATYWELYPETLGTHIETEYRDAMESRTESLLEPFFWEPHRRWISVRILPIDPDGTQECLDGIALLYQDVTEQLQTEQSRRSSDQRYRVLTELSPQSLWMADADGLTRFANQRFLDYIGQQFVPVTGEEYIQCFDPRDRERVVAAWTHSVATGENYSIEARLLRAADGASRWWRLAALPMRDAEGKIEQWLGSANDIHEERTRTEELAQRNRAIDAQRAELEAIYSASPIGLTLYDPHDLRILRINRRNAEVLGLTQETAVGRLITELVPEMSSALALLRRASAGEAIHGQIVQGHLPSTPGVVRTFNVNYTPLLREDGTVRAIAAASLDITEQKRAEAALIQNEKLAAVGRMASSIAHEINNPLESVTNLLYIAHQTQEAAEIHHFLDLADSELRRVSVIVNQTLRFHKQASSPREISCLDLFTTVMTMYEAKLRNSSVLVQKRKRAEQPIACFEGDIRQVLNNLVGNAIDAMPHGGRLLLRSREATDWRTGRRGLVLTIADTGHGIAPAARAQIFEAFFTTKGNQGTGLGLWISAEIVERHEGRLTMRSSQSERSHGTVFSLFLPFDAVRVPAHQRPN